MTEIERRVVEGMQWRNVDPNNGLRKADNPKRVVCWNCRACSIVDPFHVVEGGGRSLLEVPRR